MLRKQGKELFPSAVRGKNVKEIQEVAFVLGFKGRGSICLVWNYEMMRFVHIRRNRKHYGIAERELLNFTQGLR